MVCKFHSVQEGNVRPSVGAMTEGPRRPTMGSSRLILDHVADLYKDACDGFASNRKSLVMGQLFYEYKDVFSSGAHDVGLTKAFVMKFPWLQGWS